MITKEMLFQLNETLNNLLEVEKRFSNPNTEREKEILEELKNIHHDIANTINKLPPKAANSMSQGPFQNDPAFYNQSVEQPEWKETEINPIGALLDSVIEEDRAQQERVEEAPKMEQTVLTSDEQIQEPEKSEVANILDQVLEENQQERVEEAPKMAQAVLTSDEQIQESEKSEVANILDQVLEENQQERVEEAPKMAQAVLTSDEQIQESEKSEVANILDQVLEENQQERIEEALKMEQTVPTEEEPLVEVDASKTKSEPKEQFTTSSIPNTSSNLSNAQLIWNDKIRKHLEKLTPSTSKVANNYRDNRNPYYDPNQVQNITPNYSAEDPKSSSEKEYEIKNVEPTESLENITEPVAVEEPKANTATFNEENEKEPAKKPLFGIVKKVRKAYKNISKEIKIRAGIVAASLVLLTCSAINYRQPSNEEVDSPKIAKEVVKSPNLEKTDLEKKVEKYLNPIEKTEEEQTEEETASEKKDQAQEQTEDQSETEDLSETEASSKSEEQAILKLGNTTQVNDGARIYTDEYNAYLGENSLPTYYDAGEERAIIGVSILNENGLNHIFANDANANQKINDLIQNGGELVSVLTANKKYLPTYDGSDILTTDEINAYAEGWYNINDITNQNMKGIQK